MKTALVLAGGGAKGAYQAGSIKALQELGYHFDIVTGTSIGALNGLLVVQQEWETLYQLWQQLTPKDVFKYPVNFDFSIDSLLHQKNLITSFFTSYITQKGADISPFIALLQRYYNPKKFMSSPINYGLVTIKYPSLEPCQITKKEMSANTALEYAIASASCFPAFPIHYIHKQGYIDGGYYDNLPISLALQLGAKRIISIELGQEATHEYLLDRPSIIRIRPSTNLGNFLDFSRDILDKSMKLGYLDTYRTFQKYKGFTYTFDNQALPIHQVTTFYNTILEIEDTINHPSSKKIIGNLQPLTTYLLEKTYQHSLRLEDYLLLGLENILDIYAYPYDILYNYQDLFQQVLSTFQKEYQEFSFPQNSRTLSSKKLIALFKNHTTKEITYYIYQKLENKTTFNISMIVKTFPQAYLAALYFHTVK